MKDYVQKDIVSQTVSEETGADEKKKPPFPWLVRIFFLAGMVFLIGIVVYHLPSYLFEPPKTINIIGNRFLPQDTIMAYLAIKKDTTWFDLDPFELSMNLKRHPWVNQAIVHRVFPLALDVYVTERDPIAYLRVGDKMLLLGKDYLVLKNLPSVKTWNLPIIVNNRLTAVKAGDRLSPSQLGKAFQLIDTLKQDPLIPLDAVSEIIVTDPFNLEIITIPEGIKIKFGFNHFKEKLDMLRLMLPEIDKNKGNIQYLDLRYIRGVVLKKIR